MATAVKKLATKASASSTTLEPDAGALIDPRDTAKYLLRVTAGPSYDSSTHGLVHVNGSAYEVSNEFMTASINVRIRDYHGLPRTSPSTHPYFSHQNHKYDRYSISFSFTPRKDIPGGDLIMGFDFDRPIRDRLPPLFKPALKLVTTVIDPGIYCDAYADKPYIYGAALSSFFILRIGDKPEGTSGNGSETRAPQPKKSCVVQEGAEGSGMQLRKESGIPEAAEKRRRYYLKQQNLDAFTWEAGREYQADFFNPYLDFANFALRLPGISISIAKYIDEKTHTLRYVLKNRRTDEVYFVVVFTLLFGQELKDALDEERAQPEQPESIGANTAQIRDSDDDSGDNETVGTSQSSESEQGNGILSSFGNWVPSMLRSG